MFMGKVVDIDAQPRRRRTRKRPSKTALVLGGGGFTGGVYEIGALRALDLLAVNSTVNNFDIYVGTSAGSFVAGMLANGITPDEMMQVLNTRVPSELEDLDLDKVLRPNYFGFIQKAAALPLRSLELVRSLGRIGELSAIDLGVGLAEALPSGLYSGAGVNDYVEGVLADAGRAQRLPPARPRALHHGDRPRHHRADRLRREGVVRRADLEGDRVLDRAADRLQAGRAQGAPAGRRRHPLDDQRRHRGRARGEVHRRRQPDRPLRQRLREDDPDDVFGNRVRRVSDMGLPAIANQTFRILSHARLHQAVEQWQERYPGVDIVLVEPEPDDELMFGTPIMDYSRRLKIAQHGFESVTATLARDYEHFEEVAQSHGLEISGRRVRRVVERAAEEEPEQTSAWRRVLEQTTSVLLRQSGEAG